MQGMVETALSRTLTDRRTQAVSLVLGFLIAGACFVLLLFAMTYLIPDVLRWGQPSWSRLLVPLVILLIAGRGLKQSLRSRSKSVKIPATATICR
jgi:amino acid transporter